MKLLFLPLLALLLVTPRQTNADNPVVSAVSALFDALPAEAPATLVLEWSKKNAADCRRDGSRTICELQTPKAPITVTRLYIQHGERTDAFSLVTLQLNTSSPGVKSQDFAKALSAKRSRKPEKSDGWQTHHLKNGVDVYELMEDKRGVFSVHRTFDRMGVINEPGVKIDCAQAELLPESNFKLVSAKGQERHYQSSDGRKLKIDCKNNWELTLSWELPASAKMPMSDKIAWYKKVIELLQEISPHAKHAVIWNAFAKQITEELTKENPSLTAVQPEGGTRTQNGSRYGGFVVSAESHPNPNMNPTLQIAWSLPSNEICGH